MGLFQKFGKYYDLIYREVVDYEGECNFIEKVFKSFFEEKPRKILDLGCGTGSHALILAQRGYEVTGIDLSNVMIERAKKKAEEANIKADFLVQDIRTIELTEKFDCAICMFGGFGYLLTYADLVKLFSGLTRHLKERGLFIFEFWNVGGLKPSPYRTWLKRQEKNLTLYRMTESNFSPETNILTIDMHFIVIHNGKSVDIFEEKHPIRCYTIAEMRRYLGDNKFELLSFYNWDTENKMRFKEPENRTFQIMVIARSK
ncbi:MAG: class I SAM-dependent methyltransferase [Candidatus Bathyarchaeia archaeon]